MHQQKTLLYIHNSGPNPERANLTQVVNMCNAFSDLNLNVILALPLYGEANAVVKLINNNYRTTNSFTIVPFKIPMWSKILSKHFNFIFIRQIIKNYDADYCFVRNPIYAFVCTHYQKNTFFEAHNDKLHLRFKYLSKVYESVLRKVSSNPHLIAFICISEALARFWGNKGIPNEKIVILHDGYDQKNFNQIITKRNARNEVGLPQNKRIVTYTGNLFPNRGVKIIIECAMNFPDILFLIIGGPGEHKKDLINYAKRLGIVNIMFLGFIPHKNIPSYLYASDILLGIWSKDVPTINFCSPLKIFEYMASGRLIIAQSFPTIREVLSHEETAILVDPDNIEALLIGIKHALSIIDNTNIPQNALSKARENHSWQLRAKRIIALMDK